MLNLTRPNGHRLLISTDRIREVTERENGSAQLRLKDTSLQTLESPETVTALLKNAGQSPARQKRHLPQGI